MGGLLSLVCGPAAAAVRIEGQVQAGGGAVANSTVTGGQARANPSNWRKRKPVVTVTFSLPDETPGADVSLYLIAKGGHATVKTGGDNNPAIVLLTVLGSAPPGKVVINEMTTVAIAATAARADTRPRRASSKTLRRPMPFRSRAILPNGCPLGRIARLRAASNQINSIRQLIAARFGTWEVDHQYRFTLFDGLDKPVGHAAGAGVRDQ
jgi:hypothetical protein